MKIHFPSSLPIRLLLFAFLFATFFLPQLSVAQCTTAPPDMRHWWTGDNTADDLIGTNDGTLVNGATYAPGLVGQGFSFDGINDYVSIPINLSGIATFSFWMKTSIANQKITDGGPTFRTWRIEINPTGRIEYRHTPNGAGGYKLVTGSTIVSDGQWHLITTTADVPTKTISLYVDGQLEGSYTEPNSGFINWAGSAAGDVKFGKADTRNLPGPAYFNGIMDEVQHYNRALTAPEVLSIYNAGSNGLCRPGQAIPTVSEWGLIILGLIVVAGGSISVFRRKWAHVSKG